MVRGHGVMVLFLLLLAAGILESSFESVKAQLEYNYSINAELSASDYRLYTMVLTENTELTVFLTSTGGRVDIYLLDAQGTSEFLNAMLGGSPTGSWSYLPELSQIDTDYISRTSIMTEPNTYSVAVLNNLTLPVTISGTIVSQNPEPNTPVDWTIVVVVVGAAAAVILLIIVLVLIPRTYRLQAEVDSDARQPFGTESDLPQMRAGFGGKGPYWGSNNPQGSMFCGSCGERM